MKQGTLASQICDLRSKHPEYTLKEIGDLVSTSREYVRQVLSAHDLDTRGNRENKRGRSPGPNRHPKGLSATRKHKRRAIRLKMESQEEYIQHVKVRWIYRRDLLHCECNAEVYSTKCVCAIPVQVGKVIYNNLDEAMAEEI